MKKDARRLYINEDHTHFYAVHPSDDMTEADIRALVVRYADYGGTAGLLLCVSAQRALFDSCTWDPLYADDPPDGPDGETCADWLLPDARAMAPGRRGRHWIHNLGFPSVVPKPGPAPDNDFPVHLDGDGVHNSTS